MFKNRVLRGGQYVSPSVLNVLSVGDVCGSEAGWGEQHLPGWAGCFQCGMVWFLSVSLLTVIKVKCVFVDEWLESDFPLSKAPFSC